MEGLSLELGCAFPAEKEFPSSPPGSAGEPHTVSAGAGRAISEGCGSREGLDGDLVLGEVQSAGGYKNFS